VRAIEDILEDLAKVRHSINSLPDSVIQCGFADDFLDEQAGLEEELAAAEKSSTK